MGPHGEDVSAPPPTVDVATAVVLGVPVDDVTLAEAVDLIDALVASARADGRVHQVATINADFVVNAGNDAELLGILQRTSLSIPDGMPVVWAARLAGTPIRERTTGVDLLPAIVERAASRGHRIVLFGAAPGVAVEAAAALTERFPGASVVGIEAGTVGPDGEVSDEALDALRAAEPDIVGVALGNPKQERFVARYGAEVGPAVYIGIGGTLDFMTGVTKRAPTWMQDHGFEWLHRAASEPSRLAGRYARDIVEYCPAVLRQVWRGRRRRPAVAPLVESTSAVTTVRLLGSAPAVPLEPAVAAALASGRAVVVDVTALERADNATLAFLAGLVRAGRRAGVPVRTVGNTTRTMRTVSPPSVEALLHATDNAATPPG